MAQRPAWTLQENKVIKREFEFEWNGGFAVSQKRKNIVNLHNSIGNTENNRVLEVSSKSLSELGQKMSAFHLKLEGYFLENIFQAAKQYENGGPFTDLLNVEPKAAKRDERHSNSGRLMAFLYKKDKWELFPKTAFYDYIYVLAAFQTIDKLELMQVCTFDWFTDIEFNPDKSINCQAQSAAILKKILLSNSQEMLVCKERWLEFHKDSCRSSPM